MAVNLGWVFEEKQGILKVNSWQPPRDLNAWIENTPFVGKKNINLYSRLYVKPPELYGRISNTDIEREAFAYELDASGSLEHELAHLICCEDQFILDPHWGLGVAKGNTWHSLSTEQVLKEIPVNIVQLFLSAHSQNRMDEYPIFKNSDWLGYSSAYTFLRSHWIETMLNDARNIADAMPLKNIVDIWYELERKKKLLKQLLG